MGCDNIIEFLSIRNFFSSIVENDLNNERSKSEVVFYDDDNEYMISKTTADTFELIQYVLFREMQKFGENGKIRVFANTDKHLITHILNVSRFSSSPFIEQIVYFNESESLQSRVKNLEIASELIKISLNTNNYEAKYVINGVDLEKANHRMFPYFIITSDRVLAISSDYSNAYFISDSARIESFLSVYNKMLLRTSSLVEFKNTETVYKRVKDLLSEKKSDCLYSITYAPEILLFLNQSELPDLLRDDIDDRNSALENLKLLMNSLKESDSFIKKYTFFSEEGLREFQKNGIIYEYSHVIKPLSMSGRCEVLKKLRTAVSMEKLHPHKFMLKKDGLNLLQISVFFIEDQILQINLRKADNRRQVVLNKTDDLKSIVSLFSGKRDFEEFKNNIVCGNDILLEVINELIDKCCG